MKSFTKTNCKLFTEDCLIILKNIRDKRVTLINRSWRYTGPTSTKQISVDFGKALTTLVTGKIVRPCNGFKMLVFEKPNGHF